MKKEKPVIFWSVLFALVFALGIMSGFFIGDKEVYCGEVQEIEEICLGNIITEVNVYLCDGGSKLPGVGGRIIKASYPINWKDRPQIGDLIVATRAKESNFKVIQNLRIEGLPNLKKRLSNI